MKIVNFTPGLGNQIFEYIFVEYLRRRYPDQQIYGYYNAKRLHKHNGLEVHNVFDISLPHHNLWSDSVVWLCRKLNGIGIKGLKITDKEFTLKGIYFDGYYHDKHFFQDFLEDLRFRQFELDEINQDLKKQIENSNSVAIHVRRGDYLLPEIYKLFGGICTETYYRDAINVIKNKIEAPSFFVFSNDVNWVKQNLVLEHAEYVTNNTGANSFLDMYLMSLCKANIVANSTFSFWAAMLNRNAPIVVYPQKWNNFKTPDMFPEEWIGI